MTSESITTSGYVLGYLASVFYLTSRFPQIYKNVSVHVVFLSYFVFLNYVFPVRSILKINEEVVCDFCI